MFKVQKSATKTAVVLTFSIFSPSHLLASTQINDSDKIYILSKTSISEINLEKGQVSETKQFHSQQKITSITSIATDEHGQRIYLLPTHGKTNKGIQIYDFSNGREVGFIKYRNKRNKNNKPKISLIDKKIYIPFNNGLTTFNFESNRFSNFSGTYPTRLYMNKNSKYTYFIKPASEWSTLYEDQATFVRIDMSEEKKKQKTWKLPFEEELSNISVSLDDKFGYFAFSNLDNESYTFAKLIFDTKIYLEYFKIDFKHIGNRPPIIQLSSNNKQLYLFTQGHKNEKILTIDLEKKQLIGQMDFEGEIRDTSCIFKSKPGLQESINKQRLNFSNKFLDLYII